MINCKICGREMYCADDDFMDLYSKECVAQEIIDELNLKFNKHGYSVGSQSIYGCYNMDYCTYYIGDKIVKEFFTAEIFGKETKIMNNYIRNKCYLTTFKKQDNSLTLPWIKFDTMGQFLEKVKLYSMLR